MAFDICIHNVDWTGNEFLAIYVRGGCLFSRRAMYTKFSRSETIF